MPTARDEFTADEIRRILHYDPKTGVFRWRYRPEHPQKWNTRYAGQVAGSRAKTGYVYIEIRRKLPTKAARVAWVYMTGEWPTEIVDHRDGVRDNDAWNNLRLANNSQNSANKGKQRNNTSGFVGVHFNQQNGKWRARITFEGRTHDVGFYTTAEAAAAARKSYEERLKVHGQFAPDNTTRERYFHQRDTARED